MRLLRWLAVVALLSAALDPASAGARDAAAVGPPETFAAWTTVVNRRLLNRSGTPPHTPKSQGHVVITFTVARDGHVMSRAIVQPSGFAVYDKAALTILSKAEPFPPIPASDGRDEVALTQSFRFVYDRPLRHRARRTHS